MQAIPLGGHPKPPQSPLKPLTADEALAAIELYFHAARYSMPNLYALGHESDLLVITKSGYVHEVELKLSVSDFMADLRGKPGSAKWARQQVMRLARQHKHFIWGWRWADWEAFDANEEPESALDAVPLDDRHVYTDWRKRPRYLAAPTCPHRFSYAYPKSLAEKLDPLVPDLAGIMHLSEPDPDNRRVWVSVRRQAPSIHRDQTITDKAERLLLRSAYFRYGKVWRELRDTKHALRLARARQVAA